MAINFPSNPANNQIYTYDNRIWIWANNYSVWRSGTTNGFGVVSVGSTPPAAASSGDLWWNSDTGNMFVYYNDGDTSQWVMTNQVIANIGYTGSQGNVIPTLGLNSQTTSYVLTANDNGGLVSITTGGVTVPNTIFTSGQNVTIFNNSGSNQTITQGTGVTMYWISANTGNRTLQPYGLATVLCVANNTFVISGGVLT
jgi:hypothetical protein